LSKKKSKLKEQEEKNENKKNYQLIRDLEHQIELKNKDEKELIIEIKKLKKKNRGNKKRRRYCKIRRKEINWS